MLFNPVCVFVWTDELELELSISNSPSQVAYFQMYFKTLRPERHHPLSVSASVRVALLSAAEAVA